MTCGAIHARASWHQKGGRVAARHAFGPFRSGFIDSNLPHGTSGDVFSRLFGQLRRIEDVTYDFTLA
jgi:hypothetical protein